MRVLGTPGFLTRRLGLQEGMSGGSVYRDICLPWGLGTEGVCLLGVWERYLSWGEGGGKCVGSDGVGALEGGPADGLPELDGLACGAGLAGARALAGFGAAAGAGSLPPLPPPSAASARRGRVPPRRGRGGGGG